MSLRNDWDEETGFALFLLGCEVAFVAGIVALGIASSRMESSEEHTPSICDEKVCVEAIAPSAKAALGIASSRMESSEEHTPSIRDEKVCVEAIAPSAKNAPHP